MKSHRAPEICPDRLNYCVVYDGLQQAWTRGGTCSSVGNVKLQNVKSEFNQSINRSINQSTNQSFICL